MTTSHFPATTSHFPAGSTVDYFPLSHTPFRGWECGRYSTQAGVSRKIKQVGSTQTEVMV
jgi:hypothetical protein